MRKKKTIMSVGNSVERITCPFCESEEKPSFVLKNLSQLWAIFPIVVCINLSDRQDRRKHAMLEFHRVGLCGQVQFLLTQRPQITENMSESDIKQIGTIGCWRSHQEAARLVLRNAKFGLIFEDDVLFDQDLCKIERGLLEMKNFIYNVDHPQKWDIIYLGCWSFWIKPTKFIRVSHKESPTIQKCHARCFHAYCISRNFAQKISEEDWEVQQQEKPMIANKLPDFGIDSWSAYKSKHSYCLFPLIATQAPIVSSNNRAINKKMIDLALSNPKFMKVNQCLSLIGSLFAHVVLWFLSPNYRSSVMA